MINDKNKLLSCVIHVHDFYDKSIDITNFLTKQGYFSSCLEQEMKCYFIRSQYQTDLMCLRKSKVFKGSGWS